MDIERYPVFIEVIEIILGVMSLKWKVLGVRSPRFLFHYRLPTFLF